MVKNNKNNSSNSLVLGQWPQTKITHLHYLPSTLDQCAVGQCLRQIFLDSLTDLPITIYLTTNRLNLQSKVPQLDAQVTSFV